MPIKIIRLPVAAVESLNRYLSDGGAHGRVPLRARVHQCRESVWQRYKRAREKQSGDRFLLGLDLAASLQRHSK